MINNVVADDWNHSPAGIEPGKDEAHVWRALLDKGTKVIANLMTLLSQDESQRAARCHRPRRFSFSATPLPVSSSRGGGPSKSQICCGTCLNFVFADDLIR